VSLALSGGVGAPAAWGDAPKPIAPKKAAPKPQPKIVERGGPLAVRIGQTDGLTHIDFPGQGPSASRREGQDLILTFPRAAASDDLTHFKLDPTRYLKAVTVKPEGKGLQLRLTLADGVDAKLGRVDDAWAVSLVDRATASTATAAPKDQLPGARVDPAPAGGQVRMQPELQGQTLLLRFPWRAPLGAAVFRRGEAIWMVFDAKARIDISAAPHGQSQFRKIESFQGADYAAVRILAPVTTMASATAQGGVWTLALGPTAAQPSGPVAIGRDDQTGFAFLTAEVAGSTGVFWVTDPAVGDRMAVVTALPPAKGVPNPRSFVDATLLSSVQGLAVSPAVDDLQVTTDGDVVRIGRPKGLALSSVHAAAHEMAATLGLPQAAPMPALVDFDGWSKTGPGGFLPRYNQLLTLAADEEGKGKTGSVGVRLALARFLAGSELSFEALGVLDMVARSDQTILGDAEFRGLRGAARAMAGRYKDAQADFSSPVLADDPASALWRGYIAEKLGDHAGARQQFSAGRQAMSMFSEKWRGRFAESDAEAALGVNDLAAVHNAIVLASGLTLDPVDAAGLKLVQARLMEAQGQGAAALPLYDEVAASDYGALSTPAALHAVQIRLAQGKLSSADAEATLGSLRFRWRGDATELDTVRALGRLYLAEGRYREALEVLRSANGRLPELASAIAISNDLSNTFKALFLNGQADGLQPIQALALFYDFKSLTPIGADGDQMVRKLARRLVSVDLLDQAAELLKYQVDNRLDGVPKAEVSTDLAMIDLMAKRPEDALGALNNSRTTLLPTALNARRRLIEARAHLALGRYDNALELIESDKSPEAASIRAEIVWKQKSWPAAGALFEAQLGDRWKSTAPLTGEEQGELVRSGTAYSLAGDDKSLARLRARYGKLADGGNAPNLIKVALEGVDAGQLTATDFARAASDAAVFGGWVEAMKKRFAASPSPFSGGAPTAAAQAAPPAKPNGRPPLKQGA
jgi:tetratricopeptide (TPR) repeat protein